MGVSSSKLFGWGWFSLHSRARSKSTQPPRTSSETLAAACSAPTSTNPKTQVAWNPQTRLIVYFRIFLSFPYYLPQLFRPRRKMEDQIQRGHCKWFDSKKGFGFITAEDGTDLFVHQTEIKAQGFRNLAEGESVEFRVQVGHDGKRKAVSVTGPNGDFVQGEPRPRMDAGRGGYRGDGNQGPRYGGPNAGGYNTGYNNGYGNPAPGGYGY
ncbi:cold-shock DNA-binding domain-containing protein [Toxoplasma gondii GT1]|nr:cold-shock DNA-binding domain-containing protein [Toxoplasma gondii GT1]KAF4644846.1 cold-shock DNA-binding domain-containing protein [Toxoplasma gondii]